MIISNKQIDSILKAYGITDGKRRLPDDNPRAEQRGDSVEISPRARELSNIQKTITGLPEVRADLVESIKNAVEKGEYKVSSKEVAQKMLARSLVDRMIMGAD